MLLAFTRRWILFLSHGLLLIVSGICCVTQPFVSPAVVVMLCAVYWLADGAMTIALSVSTRLGRSQFSRQLFIAGCVSICAGIVTAGLPVMTATTLLNATAMWAIAHGVCEILAALRLRRYLRRELCLLLSGWFSVAAGAALLLWSDDLVADAVWALGLFAVIRGCLLAALALDLRQLRRSSSAHHTRLSYPG